MILSPKPSTLALVAFALLYPLALRGTPDDVPPEDAGRLTKARNETEQERRSRIAAREARERLLSKLDTTELRDRLKVAEQKNDELTSELSRTREELASLSRNAEQLRKEKADSERNWQVRLDEEKTDGADRLKKANDRWLAISNNLEAVIRREHMKAATLIDDYNKLAQRQFRMTLYEDSNYGGVTWTVGGRAGNALGVIGQEPNMHTTNWGDTVSSFKLELIQE